MSILNEIADKVVLLSLNEAKTDHMFRQFEKLGIRAELFQALDGRKFKDHPALHPKCGANEFACKESYHQILRQNLNTNAIALFEDDLILVDDFNSHLASFWRNVPNDWEMLYLSGNHLEAPTRIHQNVYRIHNTFCVHGVIIRKSMYDLLLKWCQEIAAPLDAILRDLQREKVAYCINPHIVYAYPNFSSIQKKTLYFTFPSPSLMKENIQKDEAYLRDFIEKMKS